MRIPLHTQRLRVAVGLALLASLFLSAMMFTNLTLGGIRLDLTEQNLYTLSPGSRRVLEKVEQPIQLHFFFSDQVSADNAALRNYATRVRELLEEYVHYADGKLSLQVVDPVPYSSEEDQAHEFGLQAVPSQDRENIYLGLVGTNAVDDVETIKFFQQQREAFLEHDISQLIYGLTNPAKPVVGVMSGLKIFGDIDVPRRQQIPEWAVIHQMRKAFEVRSIETDATQIDPDIRVLMLVHPQGLSEATWYALDQFVMHGGRLFLFVDPYADKDPAFQKISKPVEDGGIQASDAEQWLDNWGLAVDMELIAADSRLALSVQSPDRPVPVPHVAYVSANAETISREDLLTSQLSRVNFALAGSIERYDNFEGEFTSLIWTTPRSQLMEKRLFRHTSDPSRLRGFFKAAGSSLPLAARLRIQPASLFPDGPPEEATPHPEGHLDEPAEPIDAIVVADSDLLADAMWVNVTNFFGQRILRPWSGNGDFVLNALDALSGSSDLIELRGRAGFSRPFHKVDELRLQAQEEFREKEKDLKQRLKDTEEKLKQLQQQKQEDDQVLLSEQQRAERAKFQEERLRTRRELRSVRHELNRDIENLGTWLRVINIWIIPLLITVFAITLWVVQRRRRLHRSMS